MTIYIGIPVEPSKDLQQTVKEVMVKNLKKYYGNSEEDKVIFFPEKKGITVYIMDKQSFPKTESSIENVIRTILKQTFPSLEITEILFNYKRQEPDFNPVKPFEKQMSPQIPAEKESKKSEEFDYDKLSENYHAEEPHYTFEQVILPDKLKEEIEEAVATIQVESKVFDEWGLRTIIPNASSALSFYGPPGTGKSMAAEAIAQKLNKKILRATYADIESKFHGEGPKMVKAIFRAAERDKAVLFLDESDSLLSKRLTNVTDGSAQAINSMRSQLLICLEQFKGIVIFATNLVVNYDKAFLSRLISIEFQTPDNKARYAIWYQHLKGKGLHIPLGDDVNLQELADKFEFCGREIKNSVKDACVTVAISGRNLVTQADLIKAAEKTRIEYEKVLKAEDHTTAKKTEDTSVSPVTNNVVKNILQENIDKGNVKVIKADDLEGQ